MTQPISPREAKKAHLTSIIPEVVFETFNTLLSERVEMQKVVITQEEVVESLVKKGLSREEMFARHWLDIEPCYRNVGWEVEYDKPGYNETYGAYWTFRSTK